MKAEADVEGVLSKDEIVRQVSLIKRGTKYVKLLRPCSKGDGVIVFKSNQISLLLDRYEKESQYLEIEKFVPASGAATRMFKEIYNWVESPKKYELEIIRFFKDAEDLACFEDWVSAADKQDVETFEGGLNSRISWLKLLLSEAGLGYAVRPKGVIPFHQYDKLKTRTPIAEHLIEAIKYAHKNKVCRLHFTISSEFRALFEQEIEKALKLKELNGFQFEIEFSVQGKETNTVALSGKNELIYNGEKLLLRPGGHGSLIHNLNQLKSDLVFIKNIDNVCHEDRLATTVKYKKALAGLLFQFRDDLKIIKQQLDKGLIDERSIQQIRDKWDVRIPKTYRSLQAFLKRPIRVCGMVKNEGEPGGGPFWIQDEQLGESVQIIEQSQVNKKDSSQSITLKNATHFNPVDLVCFVKDLEGNSIDLTEYIDQEQCFIAFKSQNGKNIKALEWPGLWNGAMANWITIFAEVPLSTFNPVKEFKDLLRPFHKSKK